MMGWTFCKYFFWGAGHQVGIKISCRCFIICCPQKARNTNGMCIHMSFTQSMLQLAAEY